MIDEALLSISPADHGQLVKMLITLEPDGIFGSNCKLIYFKTVQPHVYITSDEVAGRIQNKEI